MTEKLPYNLMRGWMLSEQRMLLGIMVIYKCYKKRDMELIIGLQLIVSFETPF
jgi:hypothetical protein